MSITGNLLLVSDATLRGLQADPASIEQFFVSSVSDPERRDLEYAPSVDAIYSFHYAFSGRKAWESSDDEEPSPLEFLLAGGMTLPEVGYGPMRGFSSQALREIVGQLDGLDRQTVARRLVDPEAIPARGAVVMEGAAIMPMLPVALGTEDSVLALFDMLVDFLRSGVADNSALLVYTV